MCEFISWRRVKRDGEIHIIHLDNQVLFSERTREILKGSKDNDFLGHHAIDEVFSLDPSEGERGELREFWETNRLPKELRPKLKDFQTFRKNFGKMLENYAQEDDLRYIIKNAPKDEKWRGLKEFCERVLIASLLRGVTTETLKITARYDLSIEELVELAKLDGFVNGDVNGRNFKEKECSNKEKEAVLVCIHKDASVEDAEAVMKELRLRPGTVKELLSVAIDHPKKQAEFPIVETGSSWQNPDGDRDIAYLYGWHGKRFLSLFWCEYDWNGYYRFLAFREV